MVEIRETPMGGKLKDFLNVVDVIYANDPNFVRPLDLDLKERLDPKKNPFFTHGEGTTFTAYKNGRCVGRITAQIDRLHTEKFKDDTGFWGFFDTIDDPEVAKELLARAERWLKSKGMKRARGPMSLSINEEMGCLVDGFDTPPFILMPHHQKYQAGLIEQAGYEKEKDVFAWSYPVKEMNARVKKAHEELKAMPEVRSRPFSTENLDRDVDIAVEIFNDAWSENWGAVPMTQAEARKLAKDFKMILVPEITRIVVVSSGTSGRHMVEMFARLGLGEQMKPKTRQPPSGAQIADYLAAGEAELGFQQVSELLHAKGIQYLGPLPAELQNYTVYSAAVHVSAANVEAAKALLAALRSPSTQAVIRASGMEPI